MLRTISLLFRFVLKIFYGSIVVENAHLVPENGRPWYAFLMLLHILQLRTSAQHRLRQSQQFINRCSVTTLLLVTNFQLS